MILGLAGVMEKMCPQCLAILLVCLASINVNVYNELLNNTYTLLLLLLEAYHSCSALTTPMETKNNSNR